MGGTPPVQQVPDYKKTDPAVEEAIRRERDLSLRRRGRRSTILTGGSGLADNTTGGATLLSGGQ